MRDHWLIILVLSLLVAFGGPLLLGLASRRAKGQGTADAAFQVRWSWPWRLTLASALLYTLAFNLVFFVQELFLVLPKAATPGLHPVLFHNNHDWTGHNPLAELFQGTGALAILLVGLSALWWLRRTASRSASWRLFAVWAAAVGVFMSLAQVVIGAMLPPNDVGRAMDYLGLPLPLIWLAAAIALLAMAAAGTWLARPLLALADDPARIAGPAGRSLFVFQVGTLPALAGAGLVLPFRVPGSLDQVAILPVVVTLLAVAWIQAGAWRARPLQAADGLRPPSLVIPLAALAVNLLVFQLVLRPGVAF